MSNFKKKVGRPKIISEAINVRCEQELLDEIDSWRQKGNDIPSRQKIIRYFVKNFLAEWKLSIKNRNKMTEKERELLLLLAQLTISEISKELHSHGLTRNEGRGGAIIKKISDLSTSINIEANSPTEEKDSN